MNENSLYDTEKGAVAPNTSAPSAPAAQAAPMDQRRNIYPNVRRVQFSEGYQNDGNNPPQQFTCNSQQFRLVEIQKMRDDLETRIMNKENKCRKYKKQTIATEAINGVLSTVSVLSGSSAAVSAIPVITIPLAIPMGVISAVTGAASAIVLVFCRNRRKKQALITKALIDEKTVYNSIINYISKAIDDRFISDDEFQFIRKMYTPLDQKIDHGRENLDQLTQDIVSILKKL